MEGDGSPRRSHSQDREDQWERGTRWQDYRNRPRYYWGPRERWHHRDDDARRRPRSMERQAHPEWQGANRPWQHSRRSAENARGHGGENPPTNREGEGIENRGRTEKYRNAILFMIAKDNMAFETVEDEGFRYLMKTVSPLYTLPDRNIVTRAMEQKYRCLSACEKQKLEASEYFSITLDHWPDLFNTTSYLGITVHYELRNQLMSTTIGVLQISVVKSTADVIVIGKRLKSLLEEWHIREKKVIAFVVDNGANVKRVIKETFGADRYIACFAHIINSVAQDTMKFNAAKNLRAKVKKIVAFFKHSVVAADELRKVSELELIQCVETRWTSTLAMFERFISLSSQVEAILLAMPDPPPMLTAMELQLAMDFNKILGTLERLANEMCTEQYMTISKVIPSINCLRRTISSLRADISTEMATDLIITLEQSISARCGQIEENLHIAVATILDPRFKKFHFNDRAACSTAINRIAGWMRDYDETHKIIPDEVKIATLNANIEENTFWSFHDNLIQGSHTEGAEPDEIPTELEHYLNQPMLNRCGNSMVYWSRHAEIYPTLSTVAKKYLVLVATSVPAKQLFSVSQRGNILINNRSSLSPSHLNQLLFLNSLSQSDWQL